MLRPLPAHETDHLHGRLYLDRLTQRERKSALREMAAAQDEVFARRAARSSSAASSS